VRRTLAALGVLGLALGSLLFAPDARAQVPPTTTTTIDPQAAAARAAAGWSPPTPRIRTNPPPGRAQVAGLATWLWVEPPGPVQFTTPEGLAMQARAASVRFDFGDGATLTCAGAGTPYDPSRPESAQSSECTHAWEASSAAKTLPVRATVTWAVFFEGRPVATRQASGDLDLAVAEAQALDRRPDPMSGAEAAAGAAADAANPAGGGGRPLGELGDLVPEDEDKGCRWFDAICWGAKGAGALGDLAGDAWDGAWSVGKEVVGFVVGVGKGFGGLVGELFTIARGLTKLFGAYDLVDWIITGDGAFDEFKDTWTGLWDGVKTVFTTNPLTTGKGIWEGVWGPIRDSWKSGDYGEAVGRGAFDAVVAVFGTKGLGKAGKLKSAKKPGVPETSPKPPGGPKPPPPPKASSRVLGKNLEAAGVTRPPNSAAHHVVAGGAQAATRAQAILRKFGIDINSAENGVFLPKNTKVSNPSGAAVHSTLHTNAYYVEVNRLLSTATTRAEALEALEFIKTELSAGRFPPQVPVASATP